MSLLWTAVVVVASFLLSFCVINAFSTCCNFVPFGIFRDDVILIFQHLPVLSLFFVLSLINHVLNTHHPPFKPCQKESFVFFY